MAALYEVPLIGEAFQTFSTGINGKKVSFNAMYNVAAGFFFVDISIDEIPVVTGLKMITNTDLLASFDFDIGMLIMSGTRSIETPPNMDNVAKGLVKLYSYW